MEALCFLWQIAVEGSSLQGGLGAALFINQQPSLFAPRDKRGAERCRHSCPSERAAPLYGSLLPGGVLHCRAASCNHRSRLLLLFLAAWQRCAGCRGHTAVRCSQYSSQGSASLQSPGSSQPLFQWRNGVLVSRYAKQHRCLPADPLLSEAGCQQPSCRTHALSDPVLTLHTQLRPCRGMELHGGHLLALTEPQS